MAPRAVSLLGKYVILIDAPGSGGERRLFGMAYAARAACCVPEIGDYVFTHAHN